MGSEQTLQVAEQRSHDVCLIAPARGENPSGWRRVRRTGGVDAAQADLRSERSDAEAKAEAVRTRRDGRARRQPERAGTEEWLADKTYRTWPSW